MIIKPKLSEEEIMDNFFSMFKDSIGFVPRHQPGAELLGKAQALITSADIDPVAYLDKPYLITTQNQGYLDMFMNEMVKSACVILGSGDTLFELLLKDIPNITAIDANDLQVLFFKLKLAALKTLSAKDFERFIIDPNSNKFMSPTVFKTVKEALRDDVAALFAWEKILEINDTNELKEFFFKSIEEDVYKIRMYLSYLRKKPSFYELRDHAEKANISVITGDAIEYLLKHPEKQFKYIDITNILLFVYQLRCRNKPEKFKEVIRELKTIYDQNLIKGGTFVLDYMFGTDVTNFDRSNVGRMSLQNISDITTAQIYARTYDELSNAFALESAEIKPFIDSETLHGEICGKNESLNDTIIYTRKR